MRGWRRKDRGNLGAWNGYEVPDVFGYGNRRGKENTLTTHMRSWEGGWGAAVVWSSTTYISLHNVMTETKYCVLIEYT